MDLFYRLLRAGGHARYEPHVLVLHERASREGRLTRRPAYGFGMAAAIAIWLRTGDRFAWTVLAAWIRMRASLLLRSLVKARGEAVYEEALVLWGTMQGLVQGIPDYAPRPTDEMTRDPTVSVCIVCRNEADKLGPCLESASWADEIIVLDLESVDGSDELARRHGAQVITHEPVPVVEAVRNVVADAAPATGSSRSTPMSASPPA